MKLWEIFRFEIGLQSRRISTWLYFAVVLGFTYMMATEEFVDYARSGGYFLNSPFVTASVATMGSMIGLLITASFAGDAGARDAQTRMHPLLYTTPVGKAAYLWGRFLAAFILNLLVLVAVPAGLVLAALVPRAEADLIGPFRPGAYLGAYVLLVLPNAFIVTALLFSLSALGRKALAAYFGSALLFVHANFSWQFVAGTLEWWSLAKLLDPFSLSFFDELFKAWTPAEKNTLLVGLQGPLLANRAIWLGIACERSGAHPPALPLCPPGAGLVVEPRQATAGGWRRHALGISGPESGPESGPASGPASGRTDVRVRSPRAADVHDRMAVVPNGGDELGRVHPRVPVDRGGD